MRLARICASFLLFAAAMIALPVQAAEPVPFRIEIAAPAANMLPLWMGQETGLFEARGLDVEIVNADGGMKTKYRIG